MRYNIPILIRSIFRYSVLIFMLQLGFSTLLMAETSDTGNIDNVQISIKLKNSSIVEVFQAIEDDTDYVFAYGEEVKNLKTTFTLNYKNADVNDVLKVVGQKARLNFKRINNTISVSVARLREQKSSLLSPPLLEEAFAITVSGQVSSLEGNEPLPGVNVLVKSTSNGTITDVEGKYTLSVANETDTLIFSSIGYVSQEVPVNNRTIVDVTLVEDIQALSEIVVTGYGTQKRESVTGAISTIGSEDIGRVKGGGTSVSTGLAGKLPGVAFRQRDGRPGAGASIQIRNMGNPLYVIDGIQQDEKQFNRLSAADIESITVLKDGAAAVYGVRAANGVVVVTTKRGGRGESNTVNVDANYGFQNWVTFPKVTNSSYIWASEKIQADLNGYVQIAGRDFVESDVTNITREDLEKYRVGTERGYQSFDWSDFILQKNSPLTQVNLSTSGGSEKINYYFAGNRNYSNSVLGEEFDYGRTNIISNVDANISERLKVGLGINGYSEKTENPGIPGGDDYWLPRYAIMRNTPWERPYANDNPEYLNDIKHNETNWAYNNFELGGYLRDIRKFVQANGTAEYQIPGIEGLSARGLYSYSNEERQLDVHEYTYDAYTYFPATEDSEEEYRVTGGSSNPWRQRNVDKIQKINTQLGLNYSNVFGDHEVGALFLAERYQERFQGTFLRSVPKTNTLPLIYFDDVVDYTDADNEIARLGYIARINYSYASKYYLELSGRRDASWRFAPDQRVGYFPSASIGWRITEEEFMKSLLGSSSILDNLKLRASYGILGDDNVNLNYLGGGGDYGTGDVNYISPYAYLPGYLYNRGEAILNGVPITGSVDTGPPVRTVSWFESKILDIGADFSLFGGKLTGSVDYFNRHRTGLRGRKYDVVVPSELGYTLPDENVNSDKQFGGEAMLAYRGNLGEFTYQLGANISYARSKFDASYRPIFFNSWDEYRNSIEDRYSFIQWGYQVVGQFESQEQINNYTVNVDGEGNRTLLPGDLIYKDINGDNKIDQYDERPIGYSTNLPFVNGGLNFVFGWKGFDLALDFSLASGYSFIAENELSRAFRANGGNIAEHLRDSWKREDPYDLNSEWIPGYFPPNRFNQGGLSSVNKRSDFWMSNVTAFRGRTFQLGYSLPNSLIERFNIQQARLYFNGYNLFSWHNVKRYNIDPEVGDTNGLQYPQHRVVSFGVSLSL
ncbi:SusC/RagA family TonB-linked outer membrane protein [Catalinimonas niigatensis]|uniref:SusC/RagA family TonB-linked outer membrane protein n=1 Tax=Catalinimonas niigatensis TaxID=1397264 RepID=UPI002666B076|nr:TonB-dependent receptor [Catalinimonas niigatensis]WPP50775.1 TonB-dependent receptor [Catalinimonas niigatensis]